MSEQEATMPLAEFRKRYDADNNEWWRLASGDHQNLFDEACDQLDVERSTKKRPDVRDEVITQLAKWIEELDPDPSYSPSGRLIVGHYLAGNARFTEPELRIAAAEAIAFCEWEPRPIPGSDRGGES